jgi:hypothetical protein
MFKTLAKTVKRFYKPEPPKYYFFKNKPEPPKEEHYTKTSNNSDIQKCLNTLNSARGIDKRKGGVDVSEILNHGIITPPYYYHGTPYKYVESILKNGYNGKTIFCKPTVENVISYAWPKDGNGTGAILQFACDNIGKFMWNDSYTPKVSDCTLVAVYKIESDGLTAKRGNATIFTTDETDDETDDETTTTGGNRKTIKKRNRPTRKQKQYRKQQYRKRPKSRKQK